MDAKFEELDAKKQLGLHELGSYERLLTLYSGLPIHQERTTTFRGANYEMPDAELPLNAEVHYVANTDGSCSPLSWRKYKTDAEGASSEAGILWCGGCGGSASRGFRRTAEGWLRIGSFGRDEAELPRADSHCHFHGSAASDDVSDRLDELEERVEQLGKLEARISRIELYIAQLESERAQAAQSDAHQ